MCVYTYIQIYMYMGANLVKYLNSMTDCVCLCVQLCVRVCVV